MVPFRSFSFRTLVALLSLIPAIALAAPSTYDLISPIGGMTTGIDLSTYLQKIIIVTIGVAGVLAVVMIVICGIKMMTSGAVSGKSEAKECIWNAIFGLLIAIAAWALLYTINPELLKNELNLVDLPTIAGSAGGPGGGNVAGITFNWAAGPGCPQVPGTITSVVPPASCPVGGTGICCGYITIPSSPGGGLPPPPGTPPPSALPPPPTTPPPPPIIPPPLSGLQLSTTRYNVQKTASTVLITVIRTGPITGTISINYGTANGTAISGVNFTGVSGTLTFAPGVMTQTFSVPIIPTTAIVGNKQFTVQLSSPSPGVQLNASVATVTIVDSQSSGGPSTGTDTVAPVVQIINPVTGFISSLPLIAVDFSVTENMNLQNVTLNVINNATGFNIFSKIICNDFSTPCPALGLTGTAIASLPTYIGSSNLTISVTACDVNSNCGTGSVKGQYVQYCPTGDPRCKNDSLALQNCMGQAVSGSCSRADLNKDGVINNADLLILDGARAYDINRDGVIDTKTLATNFADTCTFHTAQDALLPCSIRVLGNITLTATDRTTLGNIYLTAQTSIDKFSLTLLDAALCAKFGCTTAGLGLGGTNQLSIYGESMLTTFRAYDFNGDGIIDGDPTGADMLFFQACAKDPKTAGCAKADTNLDGYVTNSDLNLLYSATWAWENKDSTLSNLERIFWGGDMQPEAGIINVCQGADNILLCGAADLNKDTVINAADATFLLGANIYDINGDGIIVYTTPIIPVPVSGTSATATSTKFIIGDLVATTNSLIVRAAPGDASQFLGTIPMGSKGTVIGGPIFADGNWWWKIAYTGSFTGWSIEPFLQKSTATITPPPPPPSSIISTKFVLNERVGTTANLNVRATAGLAGTFIGMIPTNTTRGNIIGGPTLKDGYWWWQVKWDSGITGWSVEDYMKEFTPPPAPKITAPTNNSYVASSTVKIVGTMPSAEVGGVVSIQKGTTVLGTTTISASGAWQTNLKFTDGTYTIIAIATDQSANIGPTSTPVTFTVDTVAPNAPIVTAPGSIVAASTITITGTASEAGTIYVYSNSTSGTLLGTVTTSGSTNTWTFSKSGYVNGTYTFAIREYDLAGNIGPVTLKTVQVAVPPAAPKITVPVTGFLTNKTSMTISGTGAAAGDTLNLYSGTTLLGSAIISSTKTWSIVLSGLTDGSRTIYAIEVDTTMVSSAPSANVTFTVDTVPPAAPVITAPGATVNTSTFTMSGTAEPSSTVYVYATSTAGTLLGTAVTNSAGSWTFTLSNYANATYTFAATAHDKATNISAPTSVTIQVMAPPPAPTITSPVNGSYTNQTTISGLGFLAGHIINLYNGATLLGNATIDAAKTWSILTSLVDGVYTLYATEFDPVLSLTGAPSPTVTFTIDTVPPSPPVLTSPTNGSTVTSPVTFTGTGSQSGNMITIYVNGIQMLTTSIKGTLDWSVKYTSAPSGTYTVEVTETDQAGNVSAKTAPITATVS
jgi:hypothetical protein